MKKYVTVFKREYTVQYCEAHLRSCGLEVKHLVPHGTHLMSYQIYYPQDSHQCFSVRLDDFEKHQKDIILNFSRNKASYDRFEKSLHDCGEDYLNFSRSLAKHKTYKTHRLAKLYLTYFSKLRDYTFYVWAAHVLNDRLSRETQRLIEQKCLIHKKPSKLSLYLDSIFTPSQKTLIAGLRSMVSRNKNKWLKKENLKKLTKNFSWISCLDLQYKPWNINDMQDFVINCKVVSNNKLISLKKIAKELQFNIKEKELVYIQNHLSYIKDKRDDYRRQAVFFARNLYQRIANCFRTDYYDLLYLTKEEIINLIKKKKKINKMITIDRRKNFFLFLKNNQSICLTGGKAKLAVNQLDFINEISPIKIIKGIVATRGIVHGPVIIVRTSEDLKKVRSSDIIIAVTTNPAYLTAINKASAIVTDEGGLTCHAAIVSRELKKPCIVGTKIATKVLKDGDMVEVDAEKGIVSRLPRQNSGQVHSG